jgi:hypothetical protein
MGQQGQPEMYPEEDLVERRKTSRRKARVQAAAALGAIAIGGAVAWKLFRKG